MSGSGSVRGGGAVPAVVAGECAVCAEFFISRRIRVFFYTFFLSALIFDCWRPQKAGRFT
jgi:hypothetical protein